MKKNYFNRGIVATLAVLGLFQNNAIFAQMVGTDAFMQGNSVEIGIAGVGGYEGTNSPAPAGYHGRGFGLPFGFIANPQLNAWATFDGDFFTPGSPENGWGFEIGSSGISGSNNCSFTNDIPGTITSFTSTATCHVLDWEGDYTAGTNLHFKIEYLLEQGDLFYTTTVSITNNTAANIPDLYYYRNVDPDNNEELSGDFSTQNTIVCQPGVNGSNVACVSATSLVPASQPRSYLGFAGIGPNFRATYGGFSNRDASDLFNWTNAATYIPAIEQTVGATYFGDDAISLAYHMQNLAPGTTQTFHFNVILDDNTASNLLTVSYPGYTPAQICDTATVDTVSSCGVPIPLQIIGSTANNYTWTWSPGTGLSSTTGDSVLANPTTTTTYTVTGTPSSPCVAGTPVTVQFVFQVLGAISPPTIPPVAPVCSGSAPFNIPVTAVASGVWSGTGITNTTLGTFNPSAPGTYTVYFSYNAPCALSDTAVITVVAADPTITAVSPVCAGTASFNLTAATSGGVWSGTGITDTTLGTFNPSMAGSFMVYYTLSGACNAVDSQLVVVNSVTSPVTGFSYTSPVCIAASTQNPTPVAGFTTGGTYSSTAGLSLSPSTGAVNPAASTAGTYVISYTVPATTCGPAGTGTDTIVIEALTPPTLGFSYTTPVCASDTNQLPDTIPGFTTGGTYSSTSGLAIDPATGEVNVAGSTPGTYTVTYAVTGSNTLCTASGNTTATITINPLPAIAINTDVTMYLGQTATLWASDGDSTSIYNWSPLSTLSCPVPACDTAFATPTETTTYCVTVMNGNGCIDSTCTRVNIVIPCISNRNLDVPNAFTPNGDGNNDELCLSGWDDCIVEFEIKIFDRWGAMVFESKDPSFCWDGVYKGKKLDPAVFVYFIKASYLTDGNTVFDPRGTIDFTKKGNISLLR